MQCNGGTGGAGDWCTQAHRRAAGRKGWWRPLCCCYSTVITEHSAICYRLSLSPSLPLPLSLPPSLALSLWRLGMDQASALVRSELRALCQQRPTGTPASFERPPARAAVSDPSSAVLTSADGSLKGAARSTFRRSRVRVAAALGRSTVRPQSAPARSSDDLGGSSSSGYLALKRRHFASELRGRGSTTQLGAGMAVTGVAHTASQDSIGRSSGMPQRVHRRRRRPTRTHAAAVTSERSFVPHGYSEHGPAWRALTATSAADLPTRAAQLEEGSAELEQEEDDRVARESTESTESTESAESTEYARLLPDEELIRAGRPIPEVSLSLSLSLSLSVAACRL
eukprot:COSAG03_NODE_1832_length_3457_cov_153.246344_2_plen_340_part_00